MLRPSRPMIRPLSSSDLSSTTDTVVSTAWPDASRCITVARMLRARLSASRRVSSSIWRTRRALSWRSSSSSSRIITCLACPALRPATRSSSRICSRFDSRSSSRPWSTLRRRSSRERSCSASSVSFRSSVLSRERRRSSRRASSERRATSSSSSSSRRAAPMGAAPGCERSGALTAPPLAGSARGRCTKSTTTTATAAATSAANTISISHVSLFRRTGAGLDLEFVERCGSAPRDGGRGGVRSRTPAGRANPPYSPS